MMRKRKIYILTLGSLLLIFFINIRGYAMEISDKFSIGGILAAAYQHQDLSDAPGFENTGRGGLTFQPQIRFTPTDNDVIFAKFGFGAGNALNDGTSPFHISTWAADLEDGVKDINGRNRDYLLTVWYKHTFSLSTNHLLGITLGVIDAADYLDENAYAGDEFTQFMNGALVHKPHGFFPSYDLGAVAEWRIGAVAVKGVVMNVGTGSDENTYNYYGLQFGYLLNTVIGEGNYRFIVDRTSRDFEDSLGGKGQAMEAFVLSFDQELGDILGVWIRIGRQDDDAAIDYQNLYSGGIDISGKLWRREHDNIGIGYAILDGGNQDIDTSRIFEIYYRMPFNDYLACTFDLQYLKDDIKLENGPKGVVYGARMTAEF
jgi:hypothetical protein